MRQISPLFLTLVSAMLVLVSPALAQSRVDQPLRTLSALLEQRFKLCMSNPVCTTQEQLQLVADMTDNARDMLQRIHQTCITMSYNNCIGPQMAEVAQWHKMHKHMDDIMRTIELQYTAATLDNMGPGLKKTGSQLDVIEPAAGTAVPNPYTDPDLMQQEKQKSDWWKGWSPSGESNPYHKW